LRWHCSVRRRSGGQTVAGCNANQEVNRSLRTAPIVAGTDFPGYNTWDPTKYAQTSGFYSSKWNSAVPGVLASHADDGADGFGD
jgi:hypothetical protein